MSSLARQLGSQLRFWPQRGAKQVRQLARKLSENLNIPAACWRSLVAPLAAVSEQVSSLARQLCSRLRFWLQQGAKQVRQLAHKLSENLDTPPRLADAQRAHPQLLNACCIRR